MHRQIASHTLGEMNAKGLTPFLLAVLLTCLVFAATVVRSHPITRLVLLRKIVMRRSVAIACRRRGLRRGGTGWLSPASAGRREDGREQRDTRHIVCEDSVHRSHQDLLLLHVAPWWWFTVLQWSERVQAPVSQAGALEKASERQFVRSCHAWVVG